MVANHKGRRDKGRIAMVAKNGLAISPDAEG